MKNRITYIFRTIANIEESSVNSSKENDIAELNHLFKDGLIELGFSVEKASILREKTSEEIAKKKRRTVEDRNDKYRND